MYIYICVCLFVHIHTYIHAYINTHIHKYLYTYIHTLLTYLHASGMHTYVHKFKYIHTYIQPHIQTHVYMCTHIHICMHACMRISTCTYKYTHTWRADQGISFFRCAEPGPHSWTQHISLSTPTECRGLNGVRQLGAYPPCPVLGCLAIRDAWLQKVALQVEIHEAHHLFLAEAGWGLGVVGSSRSDFRELKTQVSACTCDMMDVEWEGSSNHLQTKVHMWCGNRFIILMYVSTLTSRRCAGTSSQCWKIAKLC